MIQTIQLANPRGFCAGVVRAIDVVEKALEKFQGPIHVNHEIVHNRFVVDSFLSKGVIFTQDIENLPKGSVYIFSAHGVSPALRKRAEDQELTIIDATCPLVTKVHWEAQKFAQDGFQIFYIGQKKHPEAVGVSGVTNMTILETLEDIEALEIPSPLTPLPEGEGNFEKVVCLTQTTLSVDDTQALMEALKAKIPHLRSPGDLCYATQNRQDAVKVLAEQSDYVVVIGSPNSSNSNKLALTSQKCGTSAKLYDRVEEIPDEVFQYENVGLTSGASVPDLLVQQVVDKAKTINPQVVINLVQTKDESGIHFPLPKEVL